MLIKGDASALEWRVKLFLSQDQVGINEILNGEDIHSKNMEAFGLPSRLVAKVFIYRLIFADAFGERGYNSPAYAYAHDPDFSQTSTSVKYWEKVIERFFEKYNGVRQHSVNLIKEAIDKGRLEIPTGRFYPITQKPNKYRGGMDWPRTEILNYPVQGFAADVMMQVRLLLRSRLRQLDYGKLALIINTVHDDCELDVDNKAELVYNICLMLKTCFQDVHIPFKRNYGFDLNVPIDGEVKYGWTLLESLLTKFNNNTFTEDFKTVCNSQFR